MADCIACKLISGELPSYKVYEDDKTLAFLEIHPITEGHVVIASKQHVEDIWGLDDETYQHVLMVGRNIAHKIKAIFDPARVGVIVEGMEFAHAHFKVFPINSGMKEPLNDQVIDDINHDALKDTFEKYQQLDA